MRFFIIATLLLWLSCASVPKINFSYYNYQMSLYQQHAISGQDYLNAAKAELAKNRTMQRQYPKDYDAEFVIEEMNSTRVIQSLLNEAKQRDTLLLNEVYAVLWKLYSYDTKAYVETMPLTSADSSSIQKMNLWLKFAVDRIHGFTYRSAHSLQKKEIHISEEVDFNLFLEKVEFQIAIAQRRVELFFYAEAPDSHSESEHKRFRQVMMAYYRRILSTCQTRIEHLLKITNAYHHYNQAEVIALESLLLQLDLENR